LFLHLTFKLIETTSIGGSRIFFRGG